MKYSDALISWLKATGFSHCYFVAGGNIMHLLNSPASSWYVFQWCTRWPLRLPPNTTTPQ